MDIRSFFSAKRRPEAKGPPAKRERGKRATRPTKKDEALARKEISAADFFSGAAAPKEEARVRREGEGESDSGGRSGDDDFVERPPGRKRRMEKKSSALPAKKERRARDEEERARREEEVEADSEDETTDEDFVVERAPARKRRMEKKSSKPLGKKERQAKDVEERARGDEVKDAYSEEDSSDVEIVIKRPTVRKSRFEKNSSQPAKKVRKAKDVEERASEDEDKDAYSEEDSSDEEFVVKRPPVRKSKFEKKSSQPAKNVLRAKDEEERASVDKNGKLEKKSSESPAKKVPAQTQKGAKEEKPSSAETPAIPLDSAKSGCLMGLTFVFTGELSSLTRDDAVDYVKTLGARVTTAVSGKTSYLVCGRLLEDGRPSTEGSKYKKANTTETVRILEGDGAFYSVIKARGDLPPTEAPAAKKRPVNPYAKSRSSMGSRSSAGSRSSLGVGPSVDAAKRLPKSIARADPLDSSALWADKYAPRSKEELLGNAENFKRLSTWLALWERQHPSGGEKGNSPKAALLSGPPGIGKTTTALLVARESDREVVEFNASDARSKGALTRGLGDILASRVLCLGGADSPRRRRCVVMDEVDGMGAGDRGGLSELLQMIKSTRVPIICICNDRQSPKMRSLVPHCLDLRYRRPTKTVVAKRMAQIAKAEGFQAEPNAIEAISESCGHDVRQVLNVMQMWSKDRNLMTYRDVKNRDASVRKDQVLRLSLFDATRMIVEAKENLYKRTDAFFSDYSLMGLNVHQNYLKVLTAPFQETKRHNDIAKELAVVRRMELATRAMSDFGMAEHAVRSGDQVWGLLPLCAALSIKTARHACGPDKCGFLPGYPEFAGWLGKNSSRGRKTRLLTEISRRLNYKVSSDNADLRLAYLPHIRTTLSSISAQHDVGRVIRFLDDYGLDRDDLFETLDEFPLGPKAENGFSSWDAKSKAAFTREYNKRAHKSQALVADQGLPKGKRRKGPKSAGDALEGEESSGTLDDTDEDEAEIQKMFRKGGKKKKAGTTKKTTTTKKTKKRGRT